MQSDRVDVCVARARRRELRRLCELDDRITDALLPRQRETKRMVQRCVPRRPCEGAAEEPLRLGLAAERAIEIGQIHHRRRERRIERERGLQLLLGPGAIAALSLEHPEVRTRFGTIRIELLSGDVFRERLRERFPIGGREPLLRRAGEHPCRLHAHATHRIR